MAIIQDSVNPKKQSKKIKCYISFNKSLITDALQKYLISRDIRPITSENGVFSSLPFHEEIMSLIKQCDLFIAILSEKQNNENVLYELGLAQGFGKRTLILTLPNYALPSDLRLNTKIHCESENINSYDIEKIEFTLNQLLFVDHRKKKKNTGKVISSTKKIGPIAEELLNKLRNESVEKNEKFFELLVKEFLDKSNISIVNEIEYKNKCFDFAVWADELENVIGNPFVIEVKKSINNKLIFDTIAKQMEQYLNESNSKWALVLFNEGPEIYSNQIKNFEKPIIFLNLSDFFGKLQKNTLESIIKNTLSKNFEKRVKNAPY